MGPQSWYNAQNNTALPNTSKHPFPRHRHLKRSMRLALPKSIIFLWNTRNAAAPRYRSQLPTHTYQQSKHTLSIHPSQVLFLFRTTHRPQAWTKTSEFPILLASLLTCVSDIVDQDREEPGLAFCIAPAPLRSGFCSYTANEHMWMEIFEFLLFALCVWRRLFLAGLFCEKVSNAEFGRHRDLSCGDP